MIVVSTGHSRQPCFCAVAYPGVRSNACSCMCRYYEHDTLGSCYSRDAMPGDLSRRMAAARARVMDAVATFVQPGVQQFTNVIDKNVALRFHESAGQVSFFSTKMNAQLLARYQEASSAAFVLQPFEGLLSVANMRPKLFLSAELATAQVRNRADMPGCIAPHIVDALLSRPHHIASATQTSASTGVRFWARIDSGHAERRMSRAFGAALACKL